MMWNLLKTFGIIALVAVIGFSMTACGSDDDNGGGGGGIIDWAGTWTSEDVSGTLTLQADGNGWDFDGTTGDEWDIDDNYMGQGRFLLLNDSGVTIVAVKFERVSSTSIRITGSTQGDTLDGIWEKQ